MRLTVATLCDAATVREDLLNVLSAGVSNITHPSYPAPLGVSLALMFEIDADEGDGEHDVKVEVRSGIESSGSSDILASLDAKFTLQRKDRPGHEGLPLSMPIPVNLHAVAVPTEGRYHVAVSMDGAQVAVLHLSALKGDAPPTL